MRYVHVHPPTVSVAAQAPNAAAIVETTIISFFVISTFISLRRDGVIAPYRSASLHDLPMAGFVRAYTADKICLDKRTNGNSYRLSCHSYGFGKAVISVLAILFQKKVNLLCRCGQFYRQIYRRIYRQVFRQIYRQALSAVCIKSP